MTGGRCLTLQGGMLLHAAAEYGHSAAAALLLDCGAAVNARAAVAEAGVSGHTATFHAVTQFGDGGIAIAKLLLEHGADRSVRVQLPGTMSNRTKSWSAHPWVTPFAFLVKSSQHADD
jgi:ankyrin repeat protein